MNSKRLTAEEAKRLTEDVNLSVISQFMNHLYDRIKVAANSGKSTIVLNGWKIGTSGHRNYISTLTLFQQKSVKSRLKDLGYELQVSIGDQRDPGTTITVSW